MEKETYLAQGICTNCGRRNYPQWGTYEVGKKISEYPCPRCGCMTWVGDNNPSSEVPPVGSVSEPN